MDGLLEYSRAIVCYAYICVFFGKKVIFKGHLPIYIVWPTSLLNKYKYGRSISNIYTGYVEVCILYVEYSYLE